AVRGLSVLLTRRRAFGRASLLALLHGSWILSASTATGQTADAVGQWSSVMSWPYEAVHAHLLPNGNVMFWPKSDNAQLWSPTNNSFAVGPKAGVNIFCSGHAFLGGGKLLVGGGHIANYVGFSDAFTYNFAT